MIESSTPAKSAVVAAPIRKLCPVYPLVSKPAVIIAFRMAMTSLSLVRNDPSLNTKKGPPTAGRMTM